jgi:hypothetical protein
LMTYYTLVKQYVELGAMANAKGNSDSSRREE